MKRILTIPFLIMFTGCATFSTRFTYVDPSGAKMLLDMPKEVDAKNLKVTMDAKKGLVEITADSIQTSNVEGIKAQGVRESSNLSKISDIAGDVTEGAIKGAVKGAIP